MHMPQRCHFTARLLLVMSVHGTFSFYALWTLRPMPWQLVAVHGALTAQLAFEGGHSRMGMLV